MKKNEQNFEDSMGRLEEIAKLLEGGSVSLEDTMTLFEEANELFQICSEKLGQAEEKLYILTGKQGSFQLKLEENE
jgi:exodeoxyribonuclease VII small subunit